MRAEPSHQGTKRAFSTSKENETINTGGDGAKILNVCLITRTNKKACEDIAARMVLNSAALLKPFAALAATPCHHLHIEIRTTKILTPTG